MSAHQSAPTDDEIGLWRSFREIYSVMSAARRGQFYLLLGLMLLGAVAELATIGAVVPFLSLLADPGAFDRFPMLASALASVGVAPSNRLVAVTVLFAAIVCVAGLVRFELARLLQNFGYDFAHDLTLEMHRRFLLQPYSFHIQRNTSTLISALDKAEILVFEVLISLMQAFIAAFIALFIVAALIIVDPVTALVAAVGFTAIYLGLSAATGARLAANSQVIARGFDERLKIAQESLGGIRDVIIDGSHSVYLEQFDRENSALCRARANTAVVSTAPRFIIEILGIVAIAAIALVAARRDGGFAAALPALGALALGAQRLLPLVQQIYKGWSSAAGYLSVVGQTVAMLRLPIEDQSKFRDVQPLTLRDRITVKGVGFTYPTRRAPALSHVSLEIPAGSRFALTGHSGSGKSTLADLLMGLLSPTEGAILIDGKPLSPANRQSWQQSIAHVPQSIFLADASISRNIALGMGDSPIDPERIVDAAAKAQLDTFIASLPEGYDTLVGDRGIRLSGGQRQRLGIARAIYKQTPLLVLDEATSALDEETERAVFEALDVLRTEGKTVVIIAHRLSTISNCDVIARLHNGRITSSTATPSSARQAG